MTAIAPRPENLVLRLREHILLDADSVSLHRLRAAIAGADREWPCSLAMAWLYESDFPNKHRDYERVLKDIEAGPDARCLAAHYLGRLRHPAAQEILIGTLDTEDDAVRAAALAALAQLGGPAAFAAITRSPGVDKPNLADLARFALALIACRHGEETFDLPRLEEDDYAPRPDSDVSGFRVEIADASEVELCLRCLGPQPFSIEMAERPAYQIRCGDDRWIVLFNRTMAMVGSSWNLRGGKHFVGIVARRVSMSGGYVSALIVLAETQPAEKTGNLLVYRASGRLAMAGSIEISGDGVQFSLRSTRGPRAFTVDIGGVFAAGRLEFGRAGLGPGEKQEPVRIFAPGND